LRGVGRATKASFFSGQALDAASTKPMSTFTTCHLIASTVSSPSQNVTPNFISLHPYAVKTHRRSRSCALPGAPKVFVQVPDHDKGGLMRSNCVLLGLRIQGVYRSSTAMQSGGSCSHHLPTGFCARVAQSCPPPAPSTRRSGKGHSSRLQPTYLITIAFQK